MRNLVTGTAAVAALGALGAATLAAAPAWPSAGAAIPTSGCTGQVIEDGTVTSKAADPIETPYTVIRPEVVPGGAAIPVVLHSHGWGGSRSTSGFEAFTDACLMVVSFDQRGFGEAGGQANVQDPDLEAQDVSSLIDAIATWPGVALDGPGDPVLGAIGASYGGGYQWMTALTELRDTGTTRFDAIAPEISWYDLPESLGPNDVPRSTWLTALYAAGAASVPQFIHEAYVWGSASGEWPNGTVLGQSAPVPDLDTVFHGHSPAAFADPDPEVRTSEQRLQLDIPALIRQGASDNLFNLNQGIKNWQFTLTDGARARSSFVSYNGGHNLPNVAPLGGPLAQAPLTAQDVCSDGAGGWDQVRIRFFHGAFGITGQDTADVFGTGTPIVGTTVDGTCVAVADFGQTGDVPADATPEQRTTAYGTTLFPMPLPVGVGAPVNLPMTPRDDARPLDESVTVYGTPRLLLSTTPAGIDQRLFFGLAKGTTPADATVIQNNLMPARWILPDPAADMAGRRTVIELPAVVAQLAPGEQLFLTVTPVSDMFAVHGSQRTPGTIAVHIMDVFLPHATVVG